MHGMSCLRPQMQSYITVVFPDQTSCLSFESRYLSLIPVDSYCQETLQGQLAGMMFQDPFSVYLCQTCSRLRHIPSTVWYHTAFRTQSRNPAHSGLSHCAVLCTDLQPVPSKCATEWAPRHVQACCLLLRQMKGLTLTMWSKDMLAATSYFCKEKPDSFVSAS